MYPSNNSAYRNPFYSSNTSPHKEKHHYQDYERTPPSLPKKGVPAQNTTPMFRQYSTVTSPNHQSTYSSSQQQHLQQNYTQTLLNSNSFGYEQQQYSNFHASGRGSARATDYSFLPQNTQDYLPPGNLSSPHVSAGYNNVSQISQTFNSSYHTSPSLPSPPISPLELPYPRNYDAQVAQHLHLQNLRVSGNPSYEYSPLNDYQQQPTIPYVPQERPKGPRKAPDNFLETTISNTSTNSTQSYYSTASTLTPGLNVLPEHSRIQQTEFPLEINTNPLTIHRLSDGLIMSPLSATSTNSSLTFMHSSAIANTSSAMNTPSSSILKVGSVNMRRKPPPAPQKELDDDIRRARSVPLKKPSSISGAVPALPKKETDRIAITRSQTQPVLNQNRKTSLDLPSMPFSYRNITIPQVKQCTQVWSLSSLFEWCKMIPIWFPSSLVSRKELIKTLIFLIHYKFKMLSSLLVDDTVDVILMEFEKFGCIKYKSLSSDEVTSTQVSRDQYVFFDLEARVSGVLPQVTVCYSTRYNHKLSPSNSSIIKDHSCYSFSCPREPTKKVDYSNEAVYKITTETGILPDYTNELGDTWSEHWGLTTEDLALLDKDLQQRQSLIFQLIRGQQQIVMKSKLILELYLESYRQQTPPLIDDPKVSKMFYDCTYNVVQPILKFHTETLLIPMIGKLKRAKFIEGISEYIYIWTREARDLYMRWIEAMITVRDIINSEKKLKDSRFITWMKNVDLDPLTKRLGDSSRLFHNYVISEAVGNKETMSSLKKRTPESHPDYKRTLRAFEAVVKLIQRINNKQGRAVDFKVLKDLEDSLIWRNIQPVDLDIVNPDRRLIHQGTILKKSGIMTSSVTLILLNNYFLVGDEIRDGEKLRISDEPINICFLMVEVDKVTNTLNEAHLNQRTNTFQSANSAVESNQDIELYPFKVRNVVGGLSYTFYANSPEEQSLWLGSFAEAQDRFYELRKTSEPFRLKVISDTCFGTDRMNEPNKIPCMAKNYPVMVAINEAEALYVNRPIPNALMKSPVVVSTSFSYQNREYCFVGLGYGIFLGNCHDSRSWKRVLDLRNVTQMKVLEEFNVLVILADRVLQYYKLSPIFSIFNGSSNDAIGEKISNEHVNFFKVGQQNGSTMLFYCKQKVSTSMANFKVVIPRLDGALKTLEKFDKHKSFNGSPESFDLTVLNKTLVIHTARGFEALSLNFLTPISSPNFNNPLRIEQASIESIKRRISMASVRPLGFFKICNNTERLLVYNELAIFCTYEGSLSRFLTLDIPFKCTKVAFQSDYLFLFGKFIVEIFYIDNKICKPGHAPKPIQVIYGRDINMIDDTPGSITFTMMHPKHPDRQLISQFIPNEFFRV